MTPDDPRHGTMAGYNQHVKDGEVGDQACFRCSVAASEYTRNVRRLKAYGRWEPWADPEPARQHARWLMSEGMPLRDIAAALDVPLSRIARLVYGKGHRHITKTRTEFAEAILQLRPVSSRVSSLGASRRLQALVAIGHSTGVIAERLGVTYARVGQIIHRREPEMFRETHDRIAALYDELHLAEPARATRSDRQRTSRALTSAKQNGWAPPLAWDDIDDPSETPNVIGVERPKKVGSGRTTELRDRIIEDAQWLADADETLTSVLSRLGMNAEHLYQTCRRANRLDLYATLSRREPAGDRAHDMRNLKAGAA